MVLETAHALRILGRTRSPPQPAGTAGALAVVIFDDLVATTDSDSVPVFGAHDSQGGITLSGFQLKNFS
ncbi:hypothetical protein RJ55_06966 [Drechmeria coniospora]|nr:hypothetical protein RJ55_06966 [Drechmeria coniospora]